ncbi:MAG: hypothetical protein IPI73_08235 [Betaproteobacteria bacterium]|nr:hypothetical protein [Betaproteobacteria bacterium]
MPLTFGIIRSNNTRSNGRRAIASNASPVHRPPSCCLRCRAPSRAAGTSRLSSYVVDHQHRRGRCRGIAGRTGGGGFISRALALGRAESNMAALDQIAPGQAGTLRRLAGSRAACGRGNDPLEGESLMSDTVPVSPSTEPGTLPAAREPARRVHPVVYIDYRIRIIGYLATGATVASTAQNTAGARAATALLWTLLLAQTLLWPHLAFLLARGSRQPQTVEKATLAVDGFLGGVWLVLIGLPLWPATVVVFTLLISATSVGGARHAGRVHGVCRRQLGRNCRRGFVHPGDGPRHPRSSASPASWPTGRRTPRRSSASRGASARPTRKGGAVRPGLQQHGVALARSLERLQALHEVTKAISSSIELQVVLDAVVRHAVRVAGADAGAIVEVEAGATVFRSLAHQNLSPGFHEKLAGIRVDTRDRVIRKPSTARSRCRCRPTWTRRVPAARRRRRGWLSRHASRCPSCRRGSRGLMLLRPRAGRSIPTASSCWSRWGNHGRSRSNAGLYRQLQAQRQAWKSRAGRNPISWPT